MVVGGVQLENAYEELGAKMVEAQESLEEAKKSGGVAWGAIWFMEREMFEGTQQRQQLSSDALLLLVDSRLPTSKMKYDHSKPFQLKQQ